MATLSIQEVVRAGLNPTLSAATAGGDEFANTGKEFIYINNGHTGAQTVTIVTQQTVDGQAVADRTVSVPAGEFRLIGPFPVATYNDSGNKTQLTYSGVTSLTIGICKLIPTN